MASSFRIFSSPAITCLSVLSFLSSCSSPCLEVGVPVREVRLLLSLLLPFGTLFLLSLSSGSSKLVKKMPCTSLHASAESSASTVSFITSTFLSKSDGNSTRGCPSSSTLLRMLSTKEDKSRDSDTLVSSSLLARSVSVLRENRLSLLSSSFPSPSSSLLLVDISAPISCSAKAASLVFDIAPFPPSTFTPGMAADSSSTEVLARSTYAEREEDAVEGGSSSSPPLPLPPILARISPSPSTILPALFASFSAAPSMSLFIFSKSLSGGLSLRLCSSNSSAAFLSAPLCACALARLDV
mmetsp:Transcript_50716/g.130819  ORF Transcript_50716/g.130819 Transcript_50716/m.130819 type:complete len:297 (-) Transcript_50716:1006-1896(-)